MHLNEFQQSLHNWISQFEEGYFPPLVNLARLFEECGELAREVNHREGPKKKRNPEAHDGLADEMGDVLFTLAALANQYGISLSECAKGVMQKVQVRDENRFTRKDSSDSEAEGEL